MLAVEDYHELTRLCLLRGFNWDANKEIEMVRTTLSWIIKGRSIFSWMGMMPLVLPRPDKIAIGLHPLEPLKVEGTVTWWVT